MGRAHLTHFPAVDRQARNGRQGSRRQHARDRFRATLEPALAEEQRERLSTLFESDPLAYVRFYPQLWDWFRREQITDLVERISTAVKTSKPHVQVTAAVFANDEDALHRRFQDWKTWLERGLLDAVCPMAYSSDTETWKRQIAMALGFSFGHQVWAGIGAYRQSPESTLEKIALARRIGVNGVILFSYGHMVTPSQWAPAGDYLERIAKGAFR